ATTSARTTSCASRTTSAGPPRRTRLLSPALRFVDEHDRDVVPDRIREPAVLCGAHEELGPPATLLLDRLLALRTRQDLEQFFVDRHRYSPLISATSASVF